MAQKLLPISFILTLVLATATIGGTINLPQTGQTTCYDSSGTVIDCTGTGQDGELKAGVSWPNPRFSPIYCDANGPCTNQGSDCDGDASTDMVQDNLTGLIWARYGSFQNVQGSWYRALSEIYSINNGNGICGYKNWRLPNFNELSSIFSSNVTKNWEWLNANGFDSIKYGNYWSSTTWQKILDYYDYAYLLDTEQGWPQFTIKTSIIGYVLPVRGGVSDTPNPGYLSNIWKTNQNISYASGDDGEFKMGVSWPGQRFELLENGNCVLDKLTGLIWTKNANLANTSLTWQGALDFIKNFNLSGGMFGFNDWRLPNRLELRSLMDFSTRTLPVGHPFENYSGSQWSSTTHEWRVSKNKAYSGIDQAINIKSSLQYVWAVRGKSSSFLAWNTFVGSADSDVGYGLAVDKNGNIYITGRSDRTWGSNIKRAHSGNGNFDAFVAKFNNQGTLQWNTFLGSSFLDEGIGLNLDTNGNIYVTGLSDSTWGEPRIPHPSGYGAFVAKLDSEGNLIWNTFLGAEAFNAGYNLVVDNYGGIYITGETDYTWKTPRRAFSKGRDAFVIKINNEGYYEWNTFLGSSGTDSGRSLALDSEGNVYVIGQSDSSWNNNVKRPYSGGADVFVAKLTSTGILQWNTFLGGPTHEHYGYGIAIDDSKNIYIAGSSYSSWGEITKNPHSGGGADIFVAKLNLDGILQWNTFLGGPLDDSSWNLVIDAGRNIYISGSSFSSWGNPQYDFSGGTDAYIAKLNNEGVFQWNMFMGSSNSDSGRGMGIDKLGNIYVTGSSMSNWGEMSISPYIGGEDAFVAKFYENQIIEKPVVTTNTATYLTSSNVTLNGTVNANGASTTVTFEYGLNTSYGTTVTADQNPVTGNSNIPVSKTITGLTPNTVYHYRVVGVNSAGESPGEDMTFITLKESNPVPNITELNPSSAVAGSSEFILTVYGSNFVNNSIINWNGNYLFNTQYFSDTELRVLIPSNYIETGDTHSVSVISPSPGGGSSYTIHFPVFSSDPNQYNWMGYLLSSINNFRYRIPFNVNVSGWEDSKYAEEKNIKVKISIQDNYGWPTNVDPGMFEYTRAYFHGMSGKIYIVYRDSAVSKISDTDISVTSNYFTGDNKTNPLIATEPNGNLYNDLTVDFDEDIEKMNNHPSTKYLLHASKKVVGKYTKFGYLTPIIGPLLFMASNGYEGIPIDIFHPKNNDRYYDENEYDIIEIPINFYDPEKNFISVTHEIPLYFSKDSDVWIYVVAKPFQPEISDKMGQKYYFTYDANFPQIDYEFHRIVKVNNPDNYINPYNGNEIHGGDTLCVKRYNDSHERNINDWKYINNYKVSLVGPKSIGIGDTGKYRLIIECDETVRSFNTPWEDIVERSEGCDFSGFSGEINLIMDRNKLGIKDLRTIQIDVADRNNQPVTLQDDVINPTETLWFSIFQSALEWTSKILIPRLAYLPLSATFNYLSWAMERDNNIPSMIDYEIPDTYSEGNLDIITIPITMRSLVSNKINKLVLAFDIAKSGSSTFTIYPVFRPYNTLGGFQQIDTSVNYINVYNDFLYPDFGQFSMPLFGATDLDLDTDGDGLTDHEESSGGTDPFQANVDIDQDKISNHEESGPTGNNLSYDGNNDGTPDRLQSNVTSLNTYDKESYLTIQSTEWTNLLNVEAKSNPAVSNSPEGIEFKYGFIKFSVNNFIKMNRLNSANSTIVKIILSPEAQINTYYKYGPEPGNESPHWYEFMYNDITKTGAIIDGNIVTLHFIDGLKGDDDLMANGIITGIGGPGNIVSHNSYLPIILR